MTQRQRECRAYGHGPFLLGRCVHCEGDELDAYLLALEIERLAYTPDEDDDLWIDLGGEA